MKTDWTEDQVSRLFDAYDDRVEAHFGYRPLIATLTGMQGTAIRVLDYGCGGGKVSRRLKAAGVAHVTGVDIAPTMIEKARAAGGADGDGLDYALIRSGSTPFPDASFDAAVSCFLFINVPEREELGRIAAEVFRVLKPGGRFYILDTNPRTTGVSYPTFRNGHPGVVYHDGDERPVFLDIPGHGVFEIIDTHWDTATYREMLSSAGFAIESVKALGVADTVSALDGEPAVDDLGGYAPFVLFQATKPHG
ncbi:class I SAM-dependent methyltransferase [Burkholderia glumae]|uniref:class I SAM-dependent methyltransferase n=1 Tax=Burkholderia glumae TaxID=337 RepID=UPI0003AA67B2|nr:class I SAM-dependent methyltransferase [Burkholderia glumae]MCM2495114.1 class I SAM-dependent methyltransferase [Burkholderia glumae]MCM2545978.1 class I SAM-dependent methyltransferase [Burkholderia glumae]UVS99222.1 class I SAM-dependent methyltransferase [Burkholderia glumae]